MARIFSEVSPTEAAARRFVATRAPLPSGISITEFVEIEMKKIEEEYKRYLFFEGEGEEGEGEEGEEGMSYSFYKMCAIGLGSLIPRNPLCLIGDYKLKNSGNFSRREFLQGAFTFFNEAMEIFDSLFNEKTKIFLSKNPDAVILPPIEQLHLINSKVQYLKILQDKGFISSDTQVLFPIDSAGNKIDFQDEAHYTELQGYLTEFFAAGALPTYDRTKYATNWKNKKGVLKLPYAGGNECVVYPNIEYDKNQGNYIYWLAVYLCSDRFLGDGRDDNEIYYLGCLGFTRGIIVDRYNPLISLIGEFRTFVSNGDVIGISYSSSTTVKILPLLFNRHIESGGMETIYNPIALESIGAAFLRSPRMKKYWNEKLSAIVNFERLFLDQIRSLSTEINKLLNLNCNRLDFCVDHATLDTGDFKLMINEVEDIAYGRGSILVFAENPLFGINMKYEQFKHLETRYPGEIDTLKENQRANLQSLAGPMTAPSERETEMDTDVMAPEQDVGASIEVGQAPDDDASIEVGQAPDVDASIEVAPEQDVDASIEVGQAPEGGTSGGGRGQSKKRKSKKRKYRRKSKRRKSKRRKSKKRKTRRKTYQ